MRRQDTVCWKNCRNFNGLRIIVANKPRYGGLTSAGAFVLSSTRDGNSSPVFYLLCLFRFLEVCLGLLFCCKSVICYVSGFVNFVLS